MDGQDAERDALALVQAALDGDDEGLAVILSHCDLRETAMTLAAVTAWLVSLHGRQNGPVLMGALRKAAQGQPVRLVSDGQRLTEVPR
jgi:hypothetical protein